MSTTDFTGFYHAHFTATVTLVYSLTSDAGEAQDVAQEAFARAWQRWGQLSTYDNPLAWVRRVSVNLARSRWRRLVTARAFLDRQREEYAEELSPDHVAVVAALRKLPQRQREAVVLHHLADLPIDEVAHILDAPMGTVKSWLHRGRSALVTELAIDLPGIVVPPAEQITERGRKRQRRQNVQLATVITAVAAILITAGLVSRGQAPPLLPQPSLSPSVSASPVPTDHRWSAAQLPAPDGLQGYASVSGVDPSGRYIIGHINEVAVLWDNLVPVMLPPATAGLRQIVPHAVNVHGVVVGTGERQGGKEGNVSWVYRDGKTTVLAKPSADERYEALAINAHGDILGSAPNTGVLRWKDTSPGTVAPQPGLGNVSEIADDGTIAGGTGDGDQPGLLTPQGFQQLAQRPGKPGGKVFSLCGDWAGGWVPGDSGGATAAARWNLRTGELRFFTDYRAPVLDIACDGSFVISYAGAVLVNSDGRQVALPSLPGTTFPETQAVGISADGKIIVGALRNSGSWQVPVVWRRA